MNEQAFATPSRRTRFSLRTLLLVTTIVALAITLSLQWRELGPLRAQVRRLRDEVGELSIDDSTKLCAIAVRTKDEFTWKWRVWIPAGHEYLLEYASEKIPKRGFPLARGTTTLSQSGEIWIEYRIARDPQSGQMMDQLSTPVGSVGSGNQDWADGRNGVSTGDGVGNTTEEFKPGEIVLLARTRVSTTVPDSTNIEDPSAGLMIWLVQTK